MEGTMENRNGALQVHQPQSLAEWNREEIDVIKKTCAQNATDAELAMFLHVCKRTGLDPLQRQIYFVKRKVNVGTQEHPDWQERPTIQAGVDGLQARALRMDDCEGIMCATVYERDTFVFDKKSGQVVKHESNVFGPQGAILGAWAIVKRRGRLPFVALVRFEEYNDPRSFLWKGKPSVMIEKVARSTALRRAYPEDFGGIYEPAEAGKEAADDMEGLTAPPLPPVVAVESLPAAAAVTPEGEDTAPADSPSGEDVPEEQPATTETDPVLAALARAETVKQLMAAMPKDAKARAPYVLAYEAARKRISGRA
jgi:phage recombination protein Bet